jgi:hypothetical protein
MNVSWTVGAKELLEALRILELVPIQTGSPTSVFYKATRKSNGKVRLSAASEVTGSVLLKGDGEWPFKAPFYIDRRLFTPFVNALPDTKKDFAFTAKGTELVIRHGGRKAHFMGQTGIPDYAEEPPREYSSKLEVIRSVRELVYCARSCATADTVSGHLNCVYLRPDGKRLTIMASNCKVLYEAKTKDTLQSKEPVPFPLFLVSLLGTQELREVHWLKKLVVLKFTHGQLWQPVSAKAAKKFPAAVITKYMKEGEKADVQFAIDTKKLARVIARIGTYLTAVSRQDWSLVLTGEKGNQEITLSSKVAQTAFHERLHLVAPLKRKIRMEWPIELLLPVFQFLAEKGKDKLLVKLHGNGVSYVQTGQIKLAISSRA